MKRKELIKQLVSNGCVMLRHGSRHDVIKNNFTGKTQPVPRHDEIDENLARHIMKELSK